MHDKFINAVINHPEWEVIRDELCGPESEEPTKFDLGGGCSVWFGEGYQTQEEADKSALFCEICWWVNHGPGYCETAPEHIKKYLRRVKAI